MPRKQAKRILTVTLKRIADEFPDTSYLEQDGFEDRLQQHRNGDFAFIGISATAEIGIPDIVAGWIRIQRIHSSGLWGIESDSDKAHIAEVEQEELHALKDQLLALGFSKRAVAAAFRDVDRQTA